MGQQPTLVDTDFATLTTDTTHLFVISMHADSRAAKLPQVVQPSRLRNAARYFSCVTRITSAGSEGAGGFWSHLMPIR